MSQAIVFFESTIHIIFFLLKFPLEVCNVSLPFNYLNIFILQFLELLLAEALVIIFDARNVAARAFVVRFATSQLQLQRFKIAFDVSVR